MDETEESQQHNMISNLPLLFANGYPTSLQKITESQLENFIPFMVQCSLGHINLQGKIDYSEPEWWPEDVPYAIPFSKPKKFNVNWLEKMKGIVNICYKFHKSLFLLRFCKDLAAYEHASLRFINNYNSTTSLFDRRNNKLLVTFRNENMSYDQPQRSRKCLLQQKSKSQTDFSSPQHMVESAPFDIYLCDNCDAELYSHEAIMEHEKTCMFDDDVIICDSPEPEEVQLNLSTNTSESNEQRNAFLLNFSLQIKGAGACNKTLNSTLPNTVDKTKEASNDDNAVIEKLKRLPRRNRAVHSLSRCPIIPLSSPAGQILIKTSKTLMTEEYLLERLDRMERFCHASILSKGTIRPKYLDKKFSPSNAQCTFKKSQDYYRRTYTFPRRQFSCRQRTENFKFLNSLLMKRCRPISIRLKKITESEIKRKRQPSNTNLNIKLTRDAKRSMNWKISPGTVNIVDTIDLCSSDEESDIAVHNNNKQTNNELSQIFHRLNSEITLTPIGKKNYSNNVNNSASASAYSISDDANSQEQIVFDEIEKQPTNRYEGNFLLSPTLNGGITKPLQPSVFLFSNYTTRPISINSFSNANNNEITSPFNSTVLESFQNQENLDNSRKKNSQSEEWFPNSSTNNISGGNIVNNNNNIRRSDRGSSKVMPIMQFNSPSRVISIDLTS